MFLKLIWHLPVIHRHCFLACPGCSSAKRIDLRSRRGQLVDAKASRQRNKKPRELSRATLSSYFSIFFFFTFRFGRAAAFQSVALVQKARIQQQV